MGCDRSHHPFIKHICYLGWVQEQFQRLLLGLLRCDACYSKAPGAHLEICQLSSTSVWIIGFGDISKQRLPPGGPTQSWVWAKISSFTWPPWMHTQVSLLGSRESEYREKLEIRNGRGCLIEKVDREFDEVPGASQSVGHMNGMK